MDKMTRVTTRVNTISHIHRYVKRGMENTEESIRKRADRRPPDSYDDVLACRLETYKLVLSVLESLV